MLAPKNLRSGRSHEQRMIVVLDSLRWSPIRSNALLYLSISEGLPCRHDAPSGMHAKHDRTR